MIGGCQDVGTRVVCPKDTRVRFLIPLTRIRRVREGRLFKPYFALCAAEKARITHSLFRNFDRAFVPVQPIDLPLLGYSKFAAEAVIPDGVCTVAHPSIFTGGRRPHL